MIRLGLLGYPLGHSLSPAIHQAALRSCGLDGIYSLFPVLPDDKQGVRDLLTHLRSGEISGLNVTIPHKQNVIEFLDELTPTAQAIGAVNTIYRRDHKLIGENTDAPGFLSDLKKALTTVPSTGIVKTRRHRVFNALVLGAGGSARAIIYALITNGWNVNLAARRIEQAKQLVDSFVNHQLSPNIAVGPITIYSFSDLGNPSPDLQHLHRTHTCPGVRCQGVQVSLLSNLSLLVNTTPVGMMPDIDQSPWPENLSLPPDAAVYDLVYNPRETKLVREACAHGLRATTGLGMLVEQAALAFEIWTGHKPSREVMREAVNRPTH